MDASDVGSSATDAADDAVVARHRGLFGRTALVAALTFVSRVLGFVREALFGALFGDASAISDAFFTAWRVPNLLRRLVGEGALGTSLQNALTEADHAGGDAAGRALFRRTLTLAARVVAGMTLVAMLVAWVLPERMPGTGWAWLGPDPEPVRVFTLQLLPFLLLISLAAVCGGALQVRGHFLAPSVGPAVMNVVWIATLAWAGWRYGAAPRAGAEEVGRQLAMGRIVAWGVLLGGLVQLAVFVPALRRVGLVGGNGKAFVPAGVRVPSAGDVLRGAVPLALGVAVFQINVMIDGLMAEGLLRDGGPSALYYANRIQEFPLALIAISATSAVFPSMKALGQAGRADELARLHGRAQAAVLFLAVPASVGLWVLARPIAAALFLHGNYGVEGVVRIAAALRMLALALVPAGACGLAGRACYARGDVRTPLRVALVSLTANVGLNMLFVRFFGMDADGLALASALVAWAGLAWLLGAMRLRVSLATWMPRLAAVALAAAASGAAAWSAQRFVAGALGRDGWAAQASGAALAAAAFAGVAAFLVVALLLRVPEAREIGVRLGRIRGRDERFGTPPSGRSESR